MILELFLAQRLYHEVPISGVQLLKEGHAKTCGLVTYVRKQNDGDYHITLDDLQGTKLVIEIIPLIPLKPPKKNEYIVVKGIVRFDKYHKWYEIHPAEEIEVVKSCLKF